jgi:xanthine/uracil permease
MAALGLGSYLSKYFKKNLFNVFATIELSIGVVGGMSSLLLFLANIYISNYEIVMYLEIILIGSLAGAIFGGCPNTTYGESVGCVAITRNASVATITLTAVMALAISFVSPFVAFLDSIPGCVMGGVCITLYGFIAVSGLKMIQKVDLENNANLFTTAVILITGIGGMSLAIGKVTLTTTACALILGIITNILVNLKRDAE